MLEMGKALQEINDKNTDVTLVSQMWSNYARNVQFNLETTNDLSKPI